MKSVSLAIGLQLLSVVILTQAAYARNEGGGGAPHMGGGGGGMPHMGGGMPAAPRMSAPAMPRMSAPAPRMSAPAMRMSAPRAPQMQMRNFAPERMPSQSMRISAPRMSEPRMSAPRMSAQPHFSSESRMGGQPRAQSRMSAAEHAPKMNTAAHERNEGAARVSEAGRSNEAARNARTAAPSERAVAAKGEGARNVGRAAAAVGALGMAEGARVAMTGGDKGGRGLVPGKSAFANPRSVSPLPRGAQPRFSKSQGSPLAYRAGATNVPRAGAKGVGRPGIMDPGGYIRSGRAANSVVNAAYAQRQLAGMANYRNTFNFNNRYRNTNVGQWPWSPWPSLGTNLGWYNNYWWNGSAFPFSYFAMNAFCPTPYCFNPLYGQFWNPGSGYCDQLPYGYNAPITVSVEEVVPVYDAWGNVVSYRPEMFCYNAFWDPRAGAYAYYDYRGQFHWVTYPALRSYETGLF